MVARIYMARLINQASGGAVVAPWEVDELPQTWIDACVGIETRPGEMAQGKQMVEQRLAEWRQAHPQYGKSRR